MKKIFILIVCLLNVMCFNAKACELGNCPQADPTTATTFCPSFRSVATCHCIAAGLPVQACLDINQIYARMIALYQSVYNACHAQRDTDPQTCIDDWTCFLNGGRDSRGGLCSGTGGMCPH